jgi:hypothetical protein
MPAVVENVDCSEHREGAVGVLHQAAIAYLGKVPQAWTNRRSLCRHLEFHFVVFMHACHANDHLPDMSLDAID